MDDELHHGLRPCHRRRQVRRRGGADECGGCVGHPGRERESVSAFNIDSCQPPAELTYRSHVVILPTILPILPTLDLKSLQSERTWTTCEYLDG